MDILYSVILGIIQGLTEFLPVSSSAHLVIAPKLLKGTSELLNSLSFAIALHAGTLTAVIWYFREKIASMIKAFFRGITPGGGRENPDFRLGLYIIAATIPAVIAALLFEEQIEGVFRKPEYTASALIVFGLVLFAADRFSVKKNDLAGITFKAAIIIGLFQALSLVPGVSRSGITITAALIMGYKREGAAEFSFLLSVPAITGAFVFGLKGLLNAGLAAGEIAAVAAGFTAAAISGFFAIKFLMAFIKKSTFLPFVIYRVMLGGVIISMAAAGVF